MKPVTTGSQRDSQAQFGRMSASYTTSRTHSGNQSLVDLSSFVDKGGGEQYGVAVDIGTGPGFTAFAIAPYAERVIATDVTPQMLEQVRGLRETRGAPRTELALVAAEALPFADGSIDLVTCRTAAHHFVDVARWLREVRRVLSADGLFVLVDTCAPEDGALAAWMHEIEVERDASHVKNLSPSEWRSAVEAAGMRVTDTAMSKVELQYPDWAERAGMSAEGMESVRDAMLGAPAAALSHFEIRQHADGTVDFAWDVVAIRAARARPRKTD
jgi:ubiquinone/menaquinone biosynthesis C-methylase UbiE